MKPGKLIIVLAAALFVLPAQAQTRTTVYLDTVLGGFSIELLDDIAPLTVANFLNYVNDGDFDGTFFHRAVTDFVLQGGDPNSATSQWFINLRDNSESLDNQNGGFTVFGRVTGSGMDVVDAIMEQPIFVFASPFESTPLINFTEGNDVRPENVVRLNSITVIDAMLTSAATAAPTSVAAGARVLFTVEVTPGTNPTSTGINVTADLSSIGGSASQALFDDGTNGDATSADNVFSFLADVRATVASGAHSITVSVSDSIARTGTTSVALTVSAGQTFSITDRGGVSLSSEGSSASTVSGYGQVEPDDGMTTPTGLAIFGFRQNGILVSEAGVPASPTLQEGRIFAEIDGPVRTGLAIANPNEGTVTIWFAFTDADGADFGNGNFTLGPGEQIARFLDEAPFNGVAPMLGTFTFTSNLPISVIALRGLTNERSEFLMTTLPVSPLTAGASDTVYFPHFADRAGWTTQVILVNPTNAALTGSVQFFGTGSETAAAEPATLTLTDTQIGSEFAYSIAPRSSIRLQTSNPAGSTQVGSVRVVADPGSSPPSGVGIFSFENGGGDGVRGRRAGINCGSGVQGLCRGQWHVGRARLDSKRPGPDEYFRNGDGGPSRTDYTGRRSDRTD